MIGRRALLAAFGFAACTPGPAFAQAPAAAVAPAVAAVAAYAGADRMQMLVDGARREGTLSLYASAPPDDLAAVTSAFESRYGAKVRLWRSSSENVLQRSLAEAHAGRFDADVFETNGAEMESLHREKILAAATSPHIAGLIPAAVPPHREWIATRLNGFVVAYNTTAVKKGELPGSYEDLLDPKWKGRLGLEADDFDWFAAVVKELGEASGLALFRDIAAGNGLSLRKGHTLLANLVVSGEVPLALNVYQYKAAQLKNDGAPIDWLVIAPAIARFQGAGIARHAPHPHAAVLFLDFLLSDAQNLAMRRDYAPSNDRVKAQYGGVPVTVIDPALVLDESDKWSKRYRDIVLGK